MNSSDWFSPCEFPVRASVIKITVKDNDVDFSHAVWIWSQNTVGLKSYWSHLSDALAHTEHVQREEVSGWCHRDSDIMFRFLAAAAASSPPEPESPVAMETISVKLLTSVRPRGGLKGETASASSAAVGLNSQEQLVSEHWFSALSLSEDPTVWTHIAGTVPCQSTGIIILCYKRPAQHFEDLPVCAACLKKCFTSFDLYLS